MVSTSFVLSPTLILLQSFFVPSHQPEVFIIGINFILFWNIMVWWFSYTNRHSVCIQWVCVCVFLPWLLSRRWLQGTQGNHLSPVNEKGRYHEGGWEKQERGWLVQGMHDNEGRSCFHLHYSWISSWATQCGFTRLALWPYVKFHEFSMRFEIQKWSLPRPQYIVPSWLVSVVYLKNVSASAGLNTTI